MHCGLQHQEVIEKSQLNKSFEMSLANLSCLVLERDQGYLFPS